MKDILGGPLVLETWKDSFVGVGEYDWREGGDEWRETGDDDGRWVCGKDDEPKRRGGGSGEATNWGGGGNGEVTVLLGSEGADTFAAPAFFSSKVKGMEEVVVNNQNSENNLTRSFYLKVNRLHNNVILRLSLNKRRNSLILAYWRQTVP